MEWLLVLVLLFVISTYYDKWKKAGPIEGRGLKGIYITYFLKIAYLTKNLSVEAKNYILKEAYYFLLNYQKKYNHENEEENISFIFDGKEDSEKTTCFALAFLLSDKNRYYPSDDFGRNMATSYYNDLEHHLGDLYDYCSIIKKPFPSQILIFFDIDSSNILKKHSQYFNQD